jgi:hypothetical protein
MNSEGARDIRLECHQFHKPFSILRKLVIYVSHKVLFFQGGRYPKALLEVTAPTTDPSSVLLVCIRNKQLKKLMRGTALQIILTLNIRNHKIIAKLSLFYIV